MSILAALIPVLFVFGLIAFAACVVVFVSAFFGEE